MAMRNCHAYGALIKIKMAEKEVVKKTEKLLETLKKKLKN
jgi:hypothetical protein